MILTATLVFLVIICSFKIVNSTCNDASKKIKTFLTSKLGSYHSLLIFLICLFILDVFIMSYIFKDVNSYSFNAYLAMCICILLASRHYILNFETIDLAKNERIDTSNKLLTALSFVCNVLYMIARAIIYFICLIIIINVLILYVHMHSSLTYTKLRFGWPLVDSIEEVNATRWFLPFEYLAFFGFNMDRETNKSTKLTTNIINPKATNLQSFLLNFFDPINPFKKENANFVKSHVLIFIIVLISSFIYGFVGISNDECNKEDTKKQFVCGFLLIGLVLCFCYMFFYFASIFFI